MNSDNNSSEGAFEVTSVSFDDVFAELQTFQHENNGSLVIPVSHPALTRIIDSLTSNCIELLVEKRWNDQMIALTNFKEEHGNCHVPATHPTLGKWVGDQRDHYKLYEKRRADPLTKKRYQRLKVRLFTMHFSITLLFPIASGSNLCFSFVSSECWLKLNCTQPMGCALPRTQTIPRAEWPL